MRLGICLPQIGTNTTPDAVDGFIESAEAVGFDSLWVEEHLFRPLEPTSGFGGVDDTPWPDRHRRLLAPLELLAYTAARTTRCTLGTTVVVAGFHHPVTLAKRVATIDSLSRGRVGGLGVGVGWCEDEHDLLGAPFRQRGKLADELLAGLLACWGPNPVAFEGEHFTIPPSETSPKPHEGDRVPLVGGFLSPAGRRRTARFCDVWQPYGLEPDEAVAGLDQINTIARDEFGRGPLEVSLRVLASPEIPGHTRAGRGGPGHWSGTLDDLIGRLRTAMSAGCHEVVIDTTFAPGATTPEAWLIQPEFLRPLCEIAHAD